jgi:hypothetical protein
MVAWLFPWDPPPHINLTATMTTMSWRSGAGSLSSRDFLISCFY